MASAWQELFRRFDNLVVGVRSSLRPRLKRIPCPRALMVVRGSGPSHCGALAAQAQVRVIPILGLDRLPLRRRRSHQFDNPTPPANLLPLSARSQLSDGRRRLAEALAAAHHRPRDPRHLVGHCNRDDPRRAPLQQWVDPAGKLGLVAAIADHGSGTEDEELAQICVALLRDLPQMDLTARSGLARDRSRLPDVGRT